MKYVVISKLSPGVDNARKALEVFLKAGMPEGTETLLAGTDGKTFITIVDEDTPDMKTSAAYGPFFESVEVMPVVPADATWLEAVHAAQSLWD
ncbi:MAG TPA: hypothetical protein VK217_12740 [Acidimicrobiales bacterium]|nr:hypothetical protein [Acidimicrobiales bacterium]